MQRIGFVISPGFQVMSFAALSVFEYANKVMDEPVYDVHVLSEIGGSVRSSIGISVATEPFDVTIFDTLIVGGGTSTPTPGWSNSSGRRRDDAGGSLRHAPVHSSWLKQACSTAGARPRTGISARDVAGAVPKSEGGGRPHLHH